MKHPYEPGNHHRQLPPTTCGACTAWWNASNARSKLPNSVRLLKTAFKRPAVQPVIAIHQIEHLTEI